MGVRGLLKLLKGAYSTDVPNVFTYLRGRVVGLDASVWMHMLFAVCYDQVGNEGRDPVAQNFISHLKRFKDAGVTVVPVFDGAPTGAKAGEMEHRSQTRKKKIETARADIVKAAASSAGVTEVLKNKLLKAEAKLDREGVAREIIHYCRRTGIAYVVAPGEADHQLVLMSKLRSIDFILTVDSDLLCHETVRFIRLKKGGFFTGKAELFDVNVCPRPTAPEQSQCLGRVVERAKIKFPSSEYADIGWRACLAYALLAGNDYFKLPKVGIARAYEALVSYISDMDSFESPDELLNVDKLLEYVQKVVKNDFSQFRNQLTQAKISFQRGLVFHLNTQMIAPLDDSYLAHDCQVFLGTPVEDKERAQLIALGLMCTRRHCPCTKERLHDLSRDSSPILSVTDSPTCEVTGFTREDETTPSRLTYDMIRGSKVAFTEIYKLTTVPFLLSIFYCRFSQFLALIIHSFQSSLAPHFGSRQS